MKFKSKFLLSKVEAVEDTLETMVGTDAVLTSGLEIQLYQGDRVSRDFDRDSLGASDEINVSPHNVLSFDVEMQSAGAAGTRPAFGDLLLACGLGETINATVDVVYTPISAAFKSVSAAFLRKQDNGQQMLINTTGIRGNLGIELSRGAFPKFKFSNMMGSYYTPVEAAPIVADTSDFIAPTPVTKDNTPTVTIDGFVACLSDFSVDFGNQITRHNAPNCRGTILGDRNITGSITLKAPDLATKNFFNTLESHQTISKIPVVIEHGTAAGKIVNVTMNTVQLSQISETDVDGELGYQFNFIAVPTAAGDDEISLTFK